LTDIGPTELRDYVFPAWADSLGWIIGTSTLIPFVVGAGYEIFVRKVVSVVEFLAMPQKIEKYIPTQRGMDLLRPTKKWMSQETKGQLDGQPMTPTSIHQ
jgi:hypothetical protein